MQDHLSPLQPTKRHLNEKALLSRRVGEKEETVPIYLRMSTDDGQENLLIILRFDQIAESDKLRETQYQVLAIYGTSRFKPLAFNKAAKLHQVKFMYV